MGRWYSKKLIYYYIALLVRNFYSFIYLYMSTQDTSLDDFEEVSAGGWAKFDHQWQQVRWVFVEYFIKEARDQFGEQIVATLDTPEGLINVWFPSSNAKYKSGVKALKVGHDVLVTLEGFWNQDKWELVTEPGKTKKGMSFAKSYSIKQSKNPNPNWKNPNMEEVTSSDVDELF